MNAKQIERAVKIKGFTVREDGGRVVASYKGREKVLTIGDKRKTVEQCLSWITDVMRIG